MNVSTPQTVAKKAIPKIWGLKNKEPVIVRTNEEGAQTYKIRILWSEKLGLILQHEFKTLEEAVKIKDKIRKHGKINIDLWIKEFNPDIKGWI